MNSRSLFIIIILQMNTKPVIIKQQYEQVVRERKEGPFRIEKRFKEGIQQYQPGGDWTDRENARYAAFIKRNEKDIEKKLTKKLWNLFKNMAEFIKTRNFLQCKNHHQKLYNKFFNIPAILEHLHASSAQFHFFFTQAQFELSVLKSSQKSEIYQTQSKAQKKPIIPLALKSSKEKEDERPTGTSYEDQELPPLEHQWGKTFQFPKIQSSVVFGNKYPKTPYSMREFPTESNLRFNSELISQRKEKQWKQCHQLFILWVSKLRKLTQGGI